MKLVESRVADDLSLREVARAAGVSPTAVYRHYPDKNHLLEAVASAGFRRLGDALEEAVGLVEDGRCGLKRAGLAYLRFARANPGLFRLMFGHVPGEADADAEALRAMHLLRVSAAAAIGTDVGSMDGEIFALRSWALVHGLAHLILDGRIDADDALLERILASHLQTMD